MGTQNKEQHIQLKMKRVLEIFFFHKLSDIKQEKEKITTYICLMPLTEILFSTRMLFLIIYL